MRRAPNVMQAPPPVAPSAEPAFEPPPPAAPTSAPTQMPTPETAPAATGSAPAFPARSTAENARMLFSPQQRTARFNPLERPTPTAPVAPLATPFPSRGHPSSVPVFGQPSHQQLNQTLGQGRAADGDTNERPRGRQRQRLFQGTNTTPDLMRRLFSPLDAPRGGDDPDALYM